MSLERQLGQQRRPPTSYDGLEDVENHENARGTESRRAGYPLVLAQNLENRIRSTPLRYFVAQRVAWVYNQTEAENVTV